jgi:hypothetical protein
MNLFFFFFFFLQFWGLNQALELARQALYHLSHTASPFFLSDIFEKGS